MYFFSLLLLICFFIFLFSAFVLTKDDFVILRKNVNQETVFNVCFAAIFIGLFFARLFFVIFNFKPVYLNPLVFLAFPYFPGFSLSGGIVGATSYVFIKSSISKFPLGRIIDFLSVSFLSALPFGFFINLFYLRKTILTFAFFVPLVLLVVFCVLLVFFLKNKFKDGTAGLLTLVSISGVLLFATLLLKKEFFLFVSPNEYFLLIPIFGVSLGLLIVQEKPFFKNFKK